MPKLYTPDGWLAFDYIFDKPRITFFFIVGARGIGKTYGALKTALDRGLPIMFMRRTQSQTDLINKPEFSPYKAINRDTGENIGIFPITKYNAAIYRTETVDGKLSPTGDPLGYTCALSTVANARGFDASDVRALIYDEFIPERHERPIKNEAFAFFNAYETINRNRELAGRAPLKAICLANSNDLGNALFLELGLVSRAERMQKNGVDYWEDEKRRIAIIMPANSPISKAKRDTALYQLTRGSEYADMALENEFSEVNYNTPEPSVLREYKPIVTVGEITIYKHKSSANLYVSEHRSGTPPTFGAGTRDLERFRHHYVWIRLEYYSDRIKFENRLCEILLQKYLG